MRPRDVTPSEGWKERAETLLRDCTDFHKAVFGQEAAVSWFVHGPVVLAEAADDIVYSTVRI